MGRSPGRTSIKGKHAKPCQYKRVQYTYDFKLAVIQFYNFSQAIDATIVTFFSHVSPAKRSALRAHVSKWRKLKDIISQQASNVRTGSHTRHRATGAATVLTAATEAVLVGWINGLRRDGIPVSNLMLHLKAIELGDETKFAASPSWKTSFLKRHRLSFRRRNRARQARPDGDNVLGQNFAREVLAWMVEHHATKVYNAEQTGIQFEMLPKRTISARGEQVVWVECWSREKQRATAMLLVDSDGNQYDLFMVFKTKNSAIKEVQEENNRLRHGFGRGLWEQAKGMQEAYGMQVYGNPTAWWNAEITVAWMEYFFGDRNANSEPVLLLLDSFSGHWTSEVLEAAARLNVHLEAVPPKLTWRCQPADVAWIKPLKDRLRRKWVEFLQKQLALREDPEAEYRMVVMSPSG